MIATPSGLESLTMALTQQIHVKAPIAAAFAALLEQMGPGNEGHAGASMPMSLEAWPGGRWFRDLGDGNGHFWGQVQAIKRPTLLEITGPLMLSYPVVSNVQYRLSEVDDGTLISLQHAAFGMIPEGYRDGFLQGWIRMLEGIRRRVGSV